MPNRKILPGDNADLTKERLTGTFDTDVLSAELYGGQEVVRRKREIISKVRQTHKGQLVTRSHYQTGKLEMAELYPAC